MSLQRCTLSPSTPYSSVVAGKPHHVSRRLSSRLTVFVAAAHKVTLVLPTGKEVSFQADSKHSIYEYAKFNNVNLPACCFQGSCSSCVSKILKGKVDQHNQCCLNAALTKEGFVALCCAVPLSDVTILTHQGGPMRKLKREMADASK